VASTREVTAALWGLSAFAFAQPLYALIQNNPPYFVVHRSTPLEVLALVGVASVLIPALIHGAVHLGRRLGAGVWLERLVIGFLGAVVTLGAVAHGVPAPVALGSSLAVGAGLTWAFWRFESVRQVALVLSLSVVVFPIFFIASTPARQVFATQAPSAAADPSGQGHPVVMVVLDELPTQSLLTADAQIDPVRYPRFAAFAAQATWYRQAATVASGTSLAVPALLAGRAPSLEAPPSSAAYPDNLFTVLAPTHRMHAIESLTQLCPGRLCRSVGEQQPLRRRLGVLLGDSAVLLARALTPPALAAGLPPISGRWMNLLDGEGPGTAADLRAADDHQHTPSRLYRRFVAELGTYPRATFHFLHLMLPHFPHGHLPSGQQYASNLAAQARDDMPERWPEDDATEAAHAYLRHLLQAGYADRLFGELIDELQRLGLYEDALIVLVADHGVSHLPGTYRRRLESANASDIALVPLIIKSPHQKAPVVVDAPVPTTDVAPTVLSILGRPIPASFTGRRLESATVERVRQILDPDFGTLGFAPGEPDLRAGLERKLAIFGEKSAEALFRLVERPELIFTAAPAGARHADPALSVEYDQGSLLNDVDRTASNLPLLLTGRVRGLGEKSSTLVLALNGQVAAAVKVADAGQFRVLLPWMLLLDGRNELTAYLWESEGPLLVGSPPEFRLEGSEPVDAFGGRVHQAEGMGYLDLCSMSDDAFTLTGWAADVASQNAVDSVRVFVNGVGRFNARMGSKRADVAEMFKKEGWLNAGFTLEVPRQAFDELYRSTVKLMAFTADNRSFELQISDGCQELMLPHDGPPQGG
jgi:hypothetical protein